MDTTINLTRSAPNHIISHNCNVGGLCMKGSIHLRSDVKKPYWYIAWYHAPEKKLYRIIKYLGETRPMHQTNQDKDCDLGYEKANKSC